MGQLLVDENGDTKLSFLARIKKWASKDRETVSAELSKGTSSGAEDTDIEVSGNSNVQHMTRMMILDQALMLRYADYESMDAYSELTCVLDVFADDSTVEDSIRNRTIWARSKDATVRDVIDDCLWRRLNIDEDIWLMSRTLCKMGNLFAEVLLTKDGVVGLNFLPAPSMRRLVNLKGGLIGFVQDIQGQFNINVEEHPTIDALRIAYKDSPLVFFQPWEVVHWRLRSKQIRSLYGFSVYDGSRWIWKRLRLLEDTSLVYKLTRSPSRFAFYVDTGDLPTAEAMKVVRQVKQGYKKKTLINQETGKLDFRYDVPSPSDDIWMATKGGKESTRIDVVGGMEWNVIDDLEYYRNKLMATSKVPRAYFENDGSDSRSSLAQKDVRFARSAMRVQRALKAGMRKVIRLHLAVLGIDPDSFEWDLQMTVPSSIFEMQQIEVLNAQADLAEKLSGYFSRDWVLQRVLHLADDEATTVSDAKDAERDRDEKEAARIQNDIQKMYPGLVMPDEPPPAPTESVTNKKVQAKLDEIEGYVKENVQTTSEVIKRIDMVGDRLLSESKKIGKKA